METEKIYDVQSLLRESIIPGYTHHDQNTLDNLIKPFRILKDNKKDNKIIILTSNVIKDNMIYSNGLYQNILNFYRMFEAMGYIPLILFDEKPHPDDIKEFIKTYRYVLPDAVVSSEIPIYSLIEIGMTVQPELRQFLRNFGTKIIKIFLGNILNIDLEISTRMADIDFSHHISGNYDLLLSSPHYKQNISYAAVINKTPYKLSKISPYVWSNEILKISLKNNINIKWETNVDWRQRNLVIMEPNLGFQKCFYVPLLIAAAFARKNPEWKGKIRIYNMQNVRRNKNFENNIYPLLGITREQIELLGRFPITELLSNNRDAIFIHHQINNEFNYMFFELMSQGYPLLHNVSTWKNYAYYYSTSDKNNMNVSKQLYNILREHHQKLGAYCAQFECLAWSHSVYNPVNQKQWETYINNPILDSIYN